MYVVEFERGDHTVVVHYSADKDEHDHFFIIVERVIAGGAEYALWDQEAKGFPPTPVMQFESEIHVKVVNDFLDRMNVDD